MDFTGREHILADARIERVLTGAWMHQGQWYAGLRVECAFPLAAWTQKWSKCQCTESLDLLEWDFENHENYQ